MVFLRALGGMIVANYASSWVGYLILAAVKGLVQSITLLWLKPFFVVCLGVSFLLSLLMEWPVVDGFFDVTVKAGNRLCDYLSIARGQLSSSCSLLFFCQRGQPYDRL